MAKTFFASIFALIFLQHSFCGEQSGERAPNSVSDDIAEGYPTGCQVYKHRRFLQCRNAGIDTIPEVKESWQVVNVDLSGNNISSVQFGNGYRSVQSINLERNNITTLSEESIQELEHIHYLSIGGNPFHCDCNMEWLRERLLGSKNHFPLVRHVQDIKCISPSSLQGRTLITISKEFLCSKGPTVEDKLLRQMTPDPGSDEVQKPVNSTANAAQIEAKHQAFEKGRVAEIVGVTLAFAAVIVVMSVAFIAM
ncbi:slit homolog 2 protein-like [Stylophora pistillata]|uniref:slit homolog 2 protein-like n=1 Tax=Stylophora pistillata TaxID=50429 RepID=UPI000C054547|nr:slit homolog 2 protein-like [Stylophora pistillata]